MSMTSRERVLTTIAHKEPDRVPYNLRVVPELLDMVESEIGIRDYAEYFAHDVRYVPGILPPLPPKPDGVPVTEWTPLRSICSDVKIAFHSCGHVTPLVMDLIEVGIDILEAVQTECMEIEQLKREFGKDITFWGGVGAQSVLARTTPEQVIEGVRRALRVMAPGGGYIAAPCHTLMEEVPWDSIVAFHQAMKAYGAYPSPGG